MKLIIMLVALLAISCVKDSEPMPGQYQYPDYNARCPHFHFDESTGATTSCNACRIITWGSGWRHDTVLSSHVRTGATITYVLNSNQQTWTFTTDSTGHWYPTVPIGVYTVTFKRRGISTPWVSEVRYNIEVGTMGDCFGNVTF